MRSAHWSARPPARAIRCRGFSRLLWGSAAAGDSRGAWSRALKHKFVVGENVYFTASNVARPAASGMYEVIRLLPTDGDDCQYRIKSTSEAFERVAKESQLDGRLTAASSADRRSQNADVRRHRRSLARNRARVSAVCDAPRVFWSQSPVFISTGYAQGDNAHGLGVWAASIEQFWHSPNLPVWATIGGCGGFRARSCSSRCCAPTGRSPTACSA